MQWKTRVGWDNTDSDTMPLNSALPGKFPHQHVRALVTYIHVQCMLRDNKRQIRVISYLWCCCLDMNLSRTSSASYTDTSSPAQKHNCTGTTTRYLFRVHTFTWMSKLTAYHFQTSGHHFPKYHTYGFHLMTSQPHFNLMETKIKVKWNGDEEQTMACTKKVLILM